MSELKITELKCNVPNSILITILKYAGYFRQRKFGQYFLKERARFYVNVSYTMRVV